MMFLAIFFLQSCQQKSGLDDGPVVCDFGGGSLDALLLVKGKEWSTSCLIMKDDNGVDLFEYKMKIIFRDENNFTSSTTQFSQNEFSGCRDEHKDFTFENSGTFNILNGEIIYHVTHFYETPHSEHAVNLNNGLDDHISDEDEFICDFPIEDEYSASETSTGEEPTYSSEPYCGMSDWSVDIRKEITGLTCWGEKNDPFKEKFKFQKLDDDLILIDNERYYLVDEVIF